MRPAGCRERAGGCRRVIAPTVLARIGALARAGAARRHRVLPLQERSATGAHSLRARLTLAATLHAGLRVEPLLPAWVERTGRTQPLGAAPSCGRAMCGVTGPARRRVLRLHQGSAIKPGGTARFVGQRFLAEPDRWGPFRALFGRARCFSLHPGVLGAQRRRAAPIQVGTATAGIRGADSWRHVSAEDDLVCLSDGDIEARRGTRQLRPDRLLTGCRAPRAGDPLAVAPVDPQRLASWARETVLQTGLGVVRAQGPWQLHRSGAPAPAGVVERLVGVPHAGGCATASRPARARGEIRQRALLRRLVTGAEAEAPGLSLRACRGLPAARMGRTQ